MIVLAIALGKTSQPSLASKVQTATLDAHDRGSPLTNPHQQKCNSARPLRILLSALLFFQLSGLAHIADDVLDGLLHPSVQHETCPVERGGGECPPGCPDCHCVYASAFTLPLAPLRIVTELAERDSASVLATDSQAPGQPLLASIFRPPRLPAALS